jgi:hypothetical protein
MRRFATLIVLGITFTVMAAAAGCTAGRTNVARGSVYEKLPYRSSTYSAHIDQIMRAKTGYPW